MTVTLSVTEGTLAITAGKQRRRRYEQRHRCRKDYHRHGAGRHRPCSNANATSTVSYVDAATRHAALAVPRTTLTSVNDNGNTGTGGSLVSVDTATITITAVNDAPVATITPVSYAATEQTGRQPEEQWPVDPPMPTPGPAP